MDQAKQVGPNRLRVLLAENHGSVRAELGLLLAREFDLVGCVPDGRELVSACSRHRPDAVVSDIRMPLVDGIEAGRRILREGFCDSVILVSLHVDEQLIREALEYGIRGYVLKLDAGEELLNAVRMVAGGGTYVSSGARGGLL
jgi:DNA-binding NarL/FixJ family response regulator